MKRVVAVLMMVGAALMLLAGPQAASAAKKTVEISGRAFIFNYMDTGISNATIKVREFPRLSTTTNELGDYSMRIPDDANVTPYIVSGEGLLTRRNKEGEPTGTMQAHWNEIDLQTFHTRGKDIRNANLQTPRDEEYAALKALLSVPDREDGRPEQCAIVTTASARNVRSVDFRTYWINTPHGVPGATSTEYPALEGPIYFNEFVIPDVTKTETSEDGGIIWPVVPTGTYRIMTTSPDARFASFLATCKPGRIINANPPWGAYQLNPGEKPLGASNVAANLVSAKVVRKGKRKRTAIVVLRAGERLWSSVAWGTGTDSGVSRFKLKPGLVTIRMPIDSRVRSKRARVVVKFKDFTGVSSTTKRWVKLPKLREKKRR